MGVRRRRPALILLSVVLIIVGGLAGAALFTIQDKRTPVLAIAREVPRGGVVTADDLREVEWTRTDGVRTVAAADRGTLVGKRAATELHPGMLVTPDLVTDRELLAPTDVIVPMPLGFDALPVTPLVVGQRILVVSTPRKDSDMPVGAMPTIEATVVAVGKRDDRSQKVVVDVAVAPADGPVLAARAYTGRIVIVTKQTGAES